MSAKLLISDGRVQLPYGDGSMEVRLPAGAEVEPLAAGDGQALPNAAEAVRSALRDPIGRPPLREWVRPTDRVAIVTSDATRPLMQAHYLPPLLAELRAAGVEDGRVEIIVGLGMHRPPTAAEIQSLLGSAAETYAVRWSDCDDEATLATIGRTSRGTPVRVFQPVAEADRVIFTGSIHHHVMAGFSAGPKSLLPGVAARDSIQANHALTLNPAPPGGMNPDCQAGKLDGNPMYEDMAEAMRMFATPAYLVNVVPAPSGGLLRAVAGDPLEAHRAGCRTAADHYTVMMPAPRGLVLASCGGYPGDINLYQSTKALINLSGALAEGGVGILLAECRDGVGAEGFQKWVRLGAPEAIEAELRRSFTVPGRVAHFVASAQRRATIVLVSGLEPEVVRACGLMPAASATEALEMAAAKLGALPPGYVMPKASVTVPALAPER